MMSPLRALVLMSIVSSGCGPCFATQTAVVVGKDCVIVASDSKQGNTIGAVRADGPELADKVIVLNARVAVTIVGTESFSFISSKTKATVYSFDAMELLRRVKNSLAADTSIFVAEGVIVDQFKSAMNGLSRYVSDRPLEEQNTIGGELTFVVAGYGNGVPVIDEIQAYWNAGKISGPTVVPKCPQPNIPVERCVNIKGRNQAILNAQSPGPERKSAAAKYPGVIRAIKMVQDSTSAPLARQEAIDVAADLIRLEVKFDPKNVGQPINYVVLSKKGEAPVSQTLAK